MLTQSTKSVLDTTLHIFSMVFIFLMLPPIMFGIVFGVILQTYLLQIHDAYYSTQLCILHSVLVILVIYNIGAGLYFVFRFVWRKYHGNSVNHSIS